MPRKKEPGEEKKRPHSFSIEDSKWNTLKTACLELFHKDVSKVLQEYAYEILGKYDRHIKRKDSQK